MAVKLSFGYTGKTITIRIKIAYQTMPYVFNPVVASLLWTNGHNFHHNNAGPLHNAQSL